uniref:Fungal lipase-like domain-containing protein n=1 Tax=Panagrolaimus sp. PS1159 TaxID=55785 RepID=A0AC35GIW0_9BILA
MILSYEPFLRNCAFFKSCSECANTTDCTGTTCTWCSETQTCVPQIFNVCPLNARVDVAYNCPWNVLNTERYDDTFVRQMVVDLICAANQQDSINIQRALQTKYPGVLVTNFYTTYCWNDTLLWPFNINSNNMLCFAYTVIIDSAKIVALVFTSTPNVPAIVAKLSNPFALPRYVDPQNLNGKVYDIFAFPFNELWTSGVANDYNSLISKVPEYKTIVIGYSIGGAIASLASDIISQRFTGELNTSNLELYTLGAPRIGDMAYAMAHDQLVPNTYRIINRLDPIPLSPPRAFVQDPPFHSRHEVWYKDSTTSNTKFTIYHMAEDPTGRISSIFSENNDHLNYFGRNLQTCLP